MDELEKGLCLSVSKHIREKALDNFAKQNKEWQMSMPLVEPLVLDFGLGDFNKMGLVEYWIANEIENGYCAKYLFVLDGQTCPRHYHKEKHETFFGVKGKVRMDYANKSFEFKAGDILSVNCREPHSFTGIGPALLLEISKPCILDDNYFDNQNIPIGGNFKG